MTAGRYTHVVIHSVDHNMVYTHSKIKEIHDAANDMGGARIMCALNHNTSSFLPDCDNACASSDTG